MKMYLIILIGSACKNCIIGRLFYNPRFLGGGPPIVDGLNLNSQDVSGSTTGNLAGVFYYPQAQIVVFIGQPTDLQGSDMKAIII
jgi:hypothetical protein